MRIGQQEIVYPHVIVKVPDGRILLTGPSPRFGQTRWSMTANTSAKPGPHDCMQAVQGMMKEILGLKWTEIDSFNIKIAKLSTIMYVDKTVVPYIVKINNKIALRIDTQRFDCIAMDYNEAVSKVIASLCGRRASDMGFSEITIRIIQTIENGGGL